MLIPPKQWPAHSREKPPKLLFGGLVFLFSFFFLLFSFTYQRITIPPQREWIQAYRDGIRVNTLEVLRRTNNIIAHVYVKLRCMNTYITRYTANAQTRACVRFERTNRINISSPKRVCDNFVSARIYLINIHVTSCNMYFFYLLFFIHLYCNA